MTNYLTSNPIFELIKCDNNYARKYDFTENMIKDYKKQVPFFQLINDDLSTPDYKLYIKFIKNFQLKSKQQMITIMSEIELKNIEYTKELGSILGSYRNFFTLCMADIKHIEGRISEQLKSKQQMIKHIEGRISEKSENLINVKEVKVV